MPRIAVGNYWLKVSAQGISDLSPCAFTLVLNQTARIDVDMKVGQVSETVEVSSSAPLLQTQTTEIGTIIDAKTNANLPLATRNYVQLTLLAPGAIAVESRIALTRIAIADERGSSLHQWQPRASQLVPAGRCRQQPGIR